MNFNKLLSFDIKFKRVANTQTGTKTSDMVDGSGGNEGPRISLPRHDFVRQREGGYTDNETFKRQCSGVAAVIVAGYIQKLKEEIDQG